MAGGAVTLLAIRSCTVKSCMHKVKGMGPAPHPLGGKKTWRYSGWLLC